MNEWVWLCSSKTKNKKTGGRPNLVHGLQFANLEVDKKVSTFHKGMPSRPSLINQKAFKNPKVALYHPDT